MKTLNRWGQLINSTAQSPDMNYAGRVQTLGLKHSPWWKKTVQSSRESVSPNFELRMMGSGGRFLCTSFSTIPMILISVKVL